MVSLVKGQKVSLAKEAPGLQKMIVGLGWDVNTSHGLRSLFSSNSDYDLDASAVVCRNGHFVSNSDLIFYGHLTGCNGAVKHCGDNLTGEGDGDDEQIIIDLARLPQDVDKIAIIVNIFQARSRRQDFGKVQNAFVRICDASSGAEVLRFNLTENYSGAIGMIFGELYKHNGEWKFNPIGAGVKEETVEAIANRFR